MINSSYRALVKHCHRLPSGMDKLLHLRRIFRVSEIKHDQDMIQIRSENAFSYLRNLECVAQLDYLRSLDTGEKLDQSELISRMSARVGLQLPVRNEN